MTFEDETPIEPVPVEAKVHIERVVACSICGALVHQRNWDHHVGWHRLWRTL